MLAKMVGVSVKLGELYADDRIKNEEAAEERLVWAVTTVLKEKERREREGVREGEGAWMSAEEVGGALECKSSSLSSGSLNLRYLHLERHSDNERMRRRDDS